MFGYVVRQRLGEQFFCWPCFDALQPLEAEEELASLELARKWALDGKIECYNCGEMFDVQY